ncbi:MAG: hypothetical protein HEQ31_24230 [Dolichospermum sp. OL03]|nr:hypothetical protein [Dolichospermum sp. OL03]MCS6282340.1 hypothetical protein [Dolichospermum sp.]
MGAGLIEQLKQVEDLSLTILTNFFVLWNETALPRPLILEGNPSNIIKHE